MGLIYNNLEDLQLNASQTVSYSNIRNIEQRLLSNDLAMTGSNMAPQIWTNRQYLDENAYGYGKGEAVWLNTENIDSFVAAHEDEIIGYAVNNQNLQAQFKELSGVEYKNERLILCRKVATGYDNYPILYYFGDLTKPVQIRISLIDDNRSLPTDDRYWKDFFVRISDTDAQLSLMNLFNESLDDNFKKHAEQYHLSGIYNSSTQLAGAYAKIDFSNIANKQAFTSHYWYKKQLTGFDCIKFFMRKKFSDNRFKWFRVWQSGLIEHGGVVDIENVDDSDNYVNGIYTVNLNWQYSDGIAPSYDYPADGFQQFYNSTTACDSYLENDIVFKKSNFNRNLRYIVQMSPINDQKTIPFKSLTNVSGFPNTCFYSNNSFSFMPANKNITLYSYLVRGYSNQSRKF